MKEKFDVNNYHETRISLLENSVAHIADTLKEIKQDIHSLRVEIKTDISNLRTESKNDISDLRKYIKIDITELNKKIDFVDLKTNAQFRWLMGTMIGFHFSLMSAVVIKVFHLI